VARTKRILLNLQLTAAAPNLAIVEAGADAPDKLVPFFEEVNYSQLNCELCEEKRIQLFTDMAKLLIGLYNEEYHFYYMKDKKIQKAISSYPRVKKSIKDMPCSLCSLSRQSKVLMVSFMLLTSICLPG
jgi:hypothetical protein